MRQLADQTVAEGLKFVEARRIAEALWSNSEEYHAGAIGYLELGVRNRRLWDIANRNGLTSDVKRVLRDV
jgi:hypothetical protein